MGYGSYIGVLICSKYFDGVPQGINEKYYFRNIIKIIILVIMLLPVGMFFKYLTYQSNIWVLYFCKTLIPQILEGIICFGLTSYLFS